jgi:hypothetical protein
MRGRRAGWSKRPRGGPTSSPSSITSCAFCPPGGRPASASARSGRSATRKFGTRARAGRTARAPGTGGATRGWGEASGAPSDRISWMPCAISSGRSRRSRPSCTPSSPSEDLWVSPPGGQWKKQIEAEALPVPGNSPGGAFGTGTVHLGRALSAALDGGDRRALAPAATFADGLAQQQVLDAARRSHAVGGAWVAIV